MVCRKIIESLLRGPDEADEITMTQEEAREILAILEAVEEKLESGLIAGEWNKALEEWNKLWEEKPKPVYKQLNTYGEYYEAGSVERYLDQLKDVGERLIDVEKKLERIKKIVEASLDTFNSIHGALAKESYSIHTLQMILELIDK